MVLVNSIIIRANVKGIIPLVCNWYIKNTVGWYKIITRYSRISQI